LKMIADKNEYSVSYYTFKNKDYNIKLKWKHTNII
jgi:hypothetical protein